MKKYLLFVLFSFTSTLPLGAQALSASLGIPVSSSFELSISADETISNSGKYNKRPSGILLFVDLPFVIGVGYEKYQVESASKNLDYKQKVEFLDIFYTLPIPVVSLAIGFGAGKMGYECDSCSIGLDYTPAWQVFAKVEIPVTILPVRPFISYHQVGVINSGNLSGDSESKWETSGRLWALGISIGF